MVVGDDALKLGSQISMGKMGTSSRKAWRQTESSEMSRCDSKLSPGQSGRWRGWLMGHWLPRNGRVAYGGDA